MEKELLKTKFIKVTFEEGTKIYTSVYLPETKNMTDKEWQEQMKELKKLIEKYSPDYIIDDNKERLYWYSPDMQAWTLNLFIDSWNTIGLKKYVHINPKEIVGMLTSQQLEEVATNNFVMCYQYKFVDDLESALHWINEKE